MSSSFSLSQSRVRFAGGTHSGKKRTANEDRFWISPDEPLAVVADGLGGHLGGAVAATLAIDSICSYYQASAHYLDTSFLLKRISKKSIQEKRLYGAITSANERVYHTSIQDQSLQGMGTTVVVTFFFETSVLIASVGDSRIYRYRDQQLKLLTTDHSVQNEYPPSAHFFLSHLSPQMMTRAIGAENSVVIDLQNERFEQGDLYLLCSDGLSNMVHEDLTKHILQSSVSLEEKVDSLIQAAQDGGGLDNITIVLAQMEER